MNCRPRGLQLQSPCSDTHTLSTRHVQVVAEARSIIERDTWDTVVQGVPVEGQSLGTDQAPVAAFGETLHRKRCDAEPFNIQKQHAGAAPFSAEHATTRGASAAPPVPISSHMKPM